VHMVTDFSQHEQWRSQSKEDLPVFAATPMLPQCMVSKNGITIWNEGENVMLIPLSTVIVDLLARKNVVITTKEAKDHVKLLDESWVWMISGQIANAIYLLRFLGQRPASPAKSDGVIVEQLTRSPFLVRFSPEEHDQVVINPHRVVLIATSETQTELLDDIKESIPKMWHEYLDKKGFFSDKKNLPSQLPAVSSKDVKSWDSVFAPEHAYVVSKKHKHGTSKHEAYGHGRAHHRQEEEPSESSSQEEEEEEVVVKKAKKKRAKHEHKQEKRKKKDKEPPAPPPPQPVSTDDPESSSSEQEQEQSGSEQEQEKSGSEEEESAAESS